MEFIHASNEHMIPGTGGDVDILISDTRAVARELNGMLTNAYRVNEEEGESETEFLGRILEMAAESVRVRKHMIAGNKIARIHKSSSEA